MSRGVGRHGDQPERRHRLLLPLQGEGVHGLDLHGVLHQPVGGIAEQDLAGRGSLFQPRGDVHRVAGDEALPGRRVAGHDLAGVHADPRGQPLAVLALEILVQRLERLAHPDRRAHGPDGVVLVETRDPEHGHHGVADELLDRAAVALDRRGHLVEVPTHHASEGFGIEALAERRGTGHVGEHDRDDLPDVTGRRRGLLERRRTTLAEPRPVGVLLPAARAPFHGRSIGGGTRPPKPTPNVPPAVLLASRGAATPFLGGLAAASREVPGSRHPSTEVPRSYRWRQRGGPGGLPQHPPGPRMSIWHER